MKTLIFSITAFLFLTSVYGQNEGTQQSQEENPQPTLTNNRKWWHIIVPQWPPVLKPDDTPSGSKPSTQHLYMVDGTVRTVWENAPNGAGTPVSETTPEPGENQFLVTVETVGDGVASHTPSNVFDDGDVATIEYQGSPFYTAPTVSGYPLGATQNANSVSFPVTENTTITINSGSRIERTVRISQVFGTRDGPETITPNNTFVSSNIPFARMSALNWGIFRNGLRGEDFIAGDAVADIDGTVYNTQNAFAPHGVTIRSTSTLWDANAVERNITIHRSSDVGADTYNGRFKTTTVSLPVSTSTVDVPMYYHTYIHTKFYRFHAPRATISDVPVVNDGSKRYVHIAYFPDSPHPQLRSSAAQFLWNATNNPDSTLGWAWTYPANPGTDMFSYDLNSYGGQKRRGTILSHPNDFPASVARWDGLFANKTEFPPEDFGHTIRHMLHTDAIYRFTSPVLVGESGNPLLLHSTHTFSVTINQKGEIVGGTKVGENLWTHPDAPLVYLQLEFL